VLAAHRTIVFLIAIVVGLIMYVNMMVYLQKIVVILNTWESLTTVFKIKHVQCSC